ncbi:hypothetical protein [Vibrio sp. TRT 17S01]|uniref:hypothetical protein n=1 Tax=Vibrio sp. TRT 17S01 TaxID=3418505 RepID=UPI003CE9040F
MKSFIFIIGIFFSTLSCSSNLENIYSKLDITTFNSSLMPMRSGNETFLSEFEQLPPPIFTEHEIRLEDEYWLYSIKLFKTKGDSLYICFLDKAKQGNYHSQTPLVLRSYGEKLVAIALQSDVCKSFSK